LNKTVLSNVRLLISFSLKKSWSLLKSAYIF
jgi:hypothetical protein